MEEHIKELLYKKAELNAHISQIAYDGLIEIKTINEENYLYLRKRINGKNELDV